jgi:hypothetical protein
VNSTLAQNPDVVEKVTGGGWLFATASAEFNSVTGHEAYAHTERSEPYIRETFGVKVLIFRDPLLPKGFRVHTAYPANFN